MTTFYGLLALVGRYMLVTIFLMAAIGQKIPKFSELNGASQHEEDWCAEHGVPESICVACNAELMPKGQLHGWCKDHGVAECVLQHPQLAQLKETPTLSTAEFERAQRALRLSPFDQFGYAPHDETTRLLSVCLIVR